MLIIYEKTIANDVIKLVNFDSEEKNTAQKLEMNQSETSGKFPYSESMSKGAAACTTYLL